MLERDFTFDTLTLNKTLEVPVKKDVATNTNGVSFSKGSVMYNEPDSSLYVANGTSLGKVVTADENGTIHADQIVADIYGFSAPRPIIYVDGTNGDDQNTGLDITKPKKTLMSARNFTGDRYAVIQFIAAGTYTFDGESVEAFDRQLGNNLYQCDDSLFTTISTHTVSSAVAGVTLDGTGTPTTVVVNTASAPASASGLFLRTNSWENSFPIVSTVTGVSITVMATDTSFFTGTVRIVSSPVTLDINNVFAGFESAAFSNVNIVNTIGPFILVDIGLVDFRRCKLDISSFSVRVGGALDFSRCILASSMPVEVLVKGTFSANSSIVNTNINAFGGYVICNESQYNGTSITVNGDGDLSARGSIFNIDISIQDSSTLSLNGAETNGALGLGGCSSGDLSRIVNITVPTSVFVSGNSMLCIMSNAQLSITSLNNADAVLAVDTNSSVHSGSTNPIVLNSNAAVVSWIHVSRTSTFNNTSEIVLGVGAPVATNAFFLRGGATVYNVAQGEGIVTATNDVNMLSAAGNAYPASGTTLLDADSVVAGAGPTVHTGDFSKYIKL